MRRTVVPLFLALALTGCGSLFSADHGVQVRLHNLSSVDFDSVLVGFPQETQRYGRLAAGRTSRYALVQQAYRYAYIEVWVAGEKYVLQPIDFVGESLLPPGTYTYGLDLAGEPPHLTIVMADQYQVQPARTLFFTAAQPATEAMQALHDGLVVRDPAGCIRLDTPDRHTVIWPHGFTLIDDDGRLDVRDAAGRTIGRIGGHFRFGGGEVPQLPAALLRSQDRDAALSQCPGRYWIVGETS